MTYPPRGLPSVVQLTPDRVAGIVGGFFEEPAQEAGTYRAAEQDPHRDDEHQDHDEYQATEHAPILTADRRVQRNRSLVGHIGGKPWWAQTAAAVAANTASEIATAGPCPSSITTSIGGVSTARSIPKLRIVKSSGLPASSTAIDSLVTQPAAI